MTKDEALRMALDALEGFIPYLPLKDEAQCNRYDKAIAAIKEALAQPEQEPVAVKHMMRWVDNLKWQSDNGQHMNIPSGLSSGTCWELAIELENFIKHTNFPQIAINPEIVGYVAPQHTWVGLADEDFYGQSKWQVMAMKYAEAKLKERNT